MTVEELLTANRSYRRFDESKPVDEQTLVGLVDLVRLCPSAANRQPLKFMVSADAQRRNLFLPALGGRLE